MAVGWSGVLMRAYRGPLGQLEQLVQYGFNMQHALCRPQSHLYELLGSRVRRQSLPGLSVRIGLFRSLNFFASESPL